MAEMLGAVASAITVAEVAVGTASVVLRLKRLWNEVHSVPEKIAYLMKQIEVLGPIIDDIELELKQRKDETHGTNPSDAALASSSDNCREALCDLNTIVCNLQSQISARKGLRRGVAKAKVVFRRQELHHYERKLQNAVLLLNAAHNNHMRTLLRRQPEMIIEHLTSGQVWKAQQLSSLERTTRPPTYLETPRLEKINQGSEFTTRLDALPTKFIQGATGNLSSNEWAAISPFKKHNYAGFSSTRPTTETRNTALGVTETSYDGQIQLPRWLTGRRWEWQLLTGCFGWKFHLRTWCTRPADSPAIRAAYHGDIVALKRMFALGTASPYDRTENGATLLHHSVIRLEYSHLDVVKLSLDLGLTFLETNFSGDNVFNWLLTFPHSRNAWGDPHGALGAYQELSARSVFDEIVISKDESYIILEFLARLDELDAPEVMHDWAQQLLPVYCETTLAERLEDVVFIGEVLSPSLLRKIIWDGNFNYSARVDYNQHATLERATILNVVAFAFGSRLGQFRNPAELDSEEYYVWGQFVREVLDHAGQEILHQEYKYPEGKMIYEMSSSVTTGTPLIWMLIGFVCRSTRQHTRGRLKQRTLQQRIAWGLKGWLLILKDYGVDLKGYGSHESRLFARNLELKSSRWDFDRNHGPRLQSIVYGSEPDDWRLTGLGFGTIRGKIPGMGGDERTTATDAGLLGG